ncbi:sodium-dependent transporter [Cysteiniphilum halobium]|uniref:sodium-dependent transporter n=1 Tax=Cysteiniphilum halobium TaxID=2219059 RepID=UPI003F832A5E
MSKIGESMGQTRKDFTSVWIFILAAVGSAAGLGNLWRFPYLAYEHGGAAFFIAYIICLLCIGLPLLILEVGLGKVSKKGAPESLALIGHAKRFKIIGWLAVLAAFGVLTYYIVITSWVLNFAVDSFQMPWQIGSESYFFHQFLGLSAGIESFGTPKLAIVFGVIAILLLVYISLYRGTSGLAFVAKWITPIPFILLIILLTNSVSLSGSITGLHALFVPVWSSLLDTKIWFAAATQVIFSISLATGVMFAYGALLDKKVKIGRTCTIVVIGDTLASIICSMIVFSVLGHVAHIDGKNIHDVVSGGIGLAFVVIPHALTLLPAAQEFFSFIFYASVFFLALTSIVSLFEAILAALMDSKIKLKRASILLVICVALLICNLFYTMGNGLYLLDVVDHFINGYLMLVVMVTEVLVIAWLYDINKLTRELFPNHNANILHVIFKALTAYIIPIVLSVLFIKQVYVDISGGYGDYPSTYLWGIGALVLVLSVVIAQRLSRKF